MQDYQCLSHAYAHKPLAVGLYRLTDDHVPRNQFGRNNPFLDFKFADSLGEMIRPSYICRYLAGKCHLIAHHYLGTQRHSTQRTNHSLCPTLHL
jgi:hypothetical protein